MSALDRSRPHARRHAHAGFGAGSRPSARRALLGDHRGVTLVEMMVALSLAAVAALVTYTVFVSTQGSFVDTREVTEQQQDARVVMNILTQEIRAAGSDGLGIGIERLALCQTDTLRIQSDLDGDGVLDAGEPAEDVLWFHDPANEAVVRRTASGDMVVLRDVVDFDFAYLDATGAPLANVPLPLEDRSRVRAVLIDLDVRITRNAERNWSTTVALRNDAAGL